MVGWAPPPSPMPPATHSPKEHGFWWSHVLWITSRPNFPTRLYNVRDLARFPELRFLDRFDTSGNVRPGGIQPAAGMRVGFFHFHHRPPVVHQFALPCHPRPSRNNIWLAYHHKAGTTTTTIIQERRAGLLLVGAYLPKCCLGSVISGPCPIRPRHQRALKPAQGWRIAVVGGGISGVDNFFRIFLNDNLMYSFAIF